MRERWSPSGQASRCTAGWTTCWTPFGSTGPGPPTLSSPFTRRTSSRRAGSSIVNQTPNAGQSSSSTEPRLRGRRPRRPLAQPPRRRSRNRRRYLAQNHRCLRVCTSATRPCAPRSACEARCANRSCRRRGSIRAVRLLGNIALARSGNASDATHWSQAESEARSAVDLVPWSAEPWRKLAVAQVGLGQIRAARASLRQAVAIEPRDWSLWYQLSEVSTGSASRRALAEANRPNPNRTSGEATPGELLGAGPSIRAPFSFSRAQNGFVLAQAETSLQMVAAKLVP